MPPVSRGGPGADDRDGPRQGGQGLLFAGPPEDERSMGPEVVGSAGPGGITGHQHARADGACGVQPGHRLGAHDPRPPSVEGGAHLVDEGVAAVRGEDEPGVDHPADDGVRVPCVDHRSEGARRSQHPHDSTGDAVSRLRDAGPGAARDDLRCVVCVEVALDDRRRPEGCDEAPAPRPRTCRASRPPEPAPCRGRRRG
ncbi:hypothetical protein WDV94_07035 [Clavibacter tessellarius]